MSPLKLRNCTSCGQAFHDRGHSLCPTCLQQNKADFETVKEYLRTHRGASVEDTIRETGVEAGRILSWLRDGQLLLKS